MFILNKFGMAVILILLLLISCLSDLGHMKGWREPGSSEAGEGWRSKDVNRYLVVKGDFNGDGIMDEARLLVRTKGDGMGLFVFISQKDHKFQTFLLDEIREKDFIQVMGISKIKPGRYKTACGKGYWECRNGEVPEILIKNDSLDYFKFESANSYFFWDEKSEKFKRVWISD